MFGKRLPSEPGMGNVDRHPDSCPISQRSHQDGTRVTGGARRAYRRLTCRNVFCYMKKRWNTTAGNWTCGLSKHAHLVHDSGRLSQRDAILPGPLTILKREASFSLRIGLAPLAGLATGWGALPAHEFRGRIGADRCLSEPGPRPISNHWTRFPKPGAVFLTNPKNVSSDFDSARRDAL